MWETITPRLENNFDLILPDLRGFGESQVVETSFSMADLAADVAEILDQLDIQKAGLVGHSMGGYIALAFARAFPQRVRGLGLVSSQVLADSTENKAGRYKQAEEILAHGVGEVAEGMPAKLTERRIMQAWLKELILRQKPQGLAGALRAMAERPDSTSLLTGFNLPLILVHGLVDALIPIERARSVKTAVPGAYLTEIPDTGHMPMMESPQKTAEAFRTLLSSRKSS